jgi:hypothetical protein
MFRVKFGMEQVPMDRRMLGFVLNGEPWGPDELVWEGVPEGIVVEEWENSVLDGAHDHLLIPFNCISEIYHVDLEN